MKTDSAVLGGGCFWCLEASFQLIEGVMKVLPGYAGGTTDNPSYVSVHDDGTGHAEVVRVEFDPAVISYADILDIFWVIHDPTTPNRQGNDVGPEYRSLVLYQGDEQKAIAEKSVVAAQKVWPDPIVTEVKPLQKFYPAEPEHIDYYKKHPEQAYCQIIINPKLQKLRAKFASKLNASTT
jgi:peptide-methionine (S)-S-oxide reductase